MRIRWETCSDCGEWLPLGPATITPDVEIEIRAEELAGGDVHWTRWETAAVDGLVSHCEDPDCSECADIRSEPSKLRDWQAGCLAAAILDEDG